MKIEIMQPEVWLNESAFTRTPEGLAERIRSLITAENRMARAVLEKRLQVGIQAETAQNYGEMIDKLLQDKALLKAPAGKLACAPLILIEIDFNYFAVKGSLPSSIIEIQTGGKILAQGHRRWLSMVSSEMTRELPSDILLLDPESFCGFNAILPASLLWIDYLNRARDLYASIPDSYSPDIEWQYFSLSGTGHWTWEKQEPEEEAFLWRGYDSQDGKWFFYWTSGNDPEQGQAMRITNDQALRTQFALTRLTTAGVKAHVTVSSDGISFKLPVRLPLCEYHYLKLMGEDLSDTYPHFEIPLSRWETIKEVLQSRLGIQEEVTNGKV